MLRGLFLDIGDTVIVEEEGKSLIDMSGRLVWGAREFLSEASERYQLLVVSNTVRSYADDIGRLLEKLKLRTYFSHILTSLDVGVAKPEPGIFKEALRVSGLTAPEVVMIGDRVETDIVGANRSGIRSILLRWRERYPAEMPGEECKPSFFATSFEEVRQIIGRL